MPLSRDFSCALRFFSRVSGTRIWSLVATLLQMAQKAVSVWSADAKKELAESELQHDAHSQEGFAKLDGMYLIGEKKSLEQQADNELQSGISSDKTLGKPRKFSLPLYFVPRQTPRQQI